MAEPFDSLRESLAASRRKGKPWGDAWMDALTWARAGTGEVRELLESTKGAWARAYLDEPATPFERAAGELFTLGATQPHGEDDVPERVCAECGGAMEGRHHTAVTCGGVCADERRRRLQRTRKPRIAQGSRELETGESQAVGRRVAA
jgi:hypothetical protein